MSSSGQIVDPQVPLSAAGVRPAARPHQDGGGAAGPGPCPLAAGNEQGAALELHLLGWSAFSAAPPDIEALRRNPELPPGVTLSASFFKHADPQTIVGFTAVSRALRNLQRPLESYGNWSVLGATRFAGRTVGHGLMSRFLEVGASASSVHIISQLSLHSLASATSVAFGIQGPNLGVGGGPDAVAEAFLTAASMFDPATDPGVWLVLTEWYPEPIPAHDGQSTVAATCHGLALALEAATDAGPVVRLVRGGSESVLSADADLSVRSLTDVLQQRAGGKAALGTWPLRQGMTLELRFPPDRSFR